MKDLIKELEALASSADEQAQRLRACAKLLSGKPPKPQKKPQKAPRFPPGFGPDPG